jgi:hypothetical protein
MEGIFSHVGVRFVIVLVFLKPQDDFFADKIFA